MGRRRSKRKPPPKRKAIEPLDIQFTCPFCNSEKSCEVIMDHGRKIGQITCNICQEDFTTTINALTEALDVYNEWIDECDKANENPNQVERSALSRTRDESDSDDDD